ncbi:MAG TPA: hypothetical protein VIP46_15980 [Pyrinomonadaceae bacterium]
MKKQGLKLLLIIICFLATASNLSAQYSRSNPRNLGQEMGKTDVYTIYTVSKANPCDQLAAIAVFDVAPETEIKINAREIYALLLPKAKQMEKDCGDRPTVFFLKVYLKNTKIGPDGSEYGMTENPPDGEEPFVDFSCDGVRGGCVWANNKYYWRPVPEESFLSDGERPLSLVTLRNKIASRKPKAETASTPTAGEIEAERSKFSSIIKLGKRNAPPSYDFGGYSNRLVMRDIYKGKFTRFPSRAELSAARSYTTPGNMLGIAADVATDKSSPLTVYLEKAILIWTNFFAYHQTYAKVCRQTKDVPWTQGTVYEFYLTKGGERVSGSETYGTTGAIREPFKESYDHAYEMLASRTKTQPEISDIMLNEYEVFLKNSGCDSPAVRQFELNLYLANSLAPLPIQVLYKPEPIPLETKKPDAPKPKAVPTKKPTPRKG